MYRMDCEKVNTLMSGEIDCDDFKAKLSLHKNVPAIINVNIGYFIIYLQIFIHSLWFLFTIAIYLFVYIYFFAGTTVKGAVDDLDLVIKTLEETGFGHDRFYIHCDGALFGLMMPFVKLVSPSCFYHKMSSFVSRTIFIFHIDD